MLSKIYYLSFLNFLDRFAYYGFRANLILFLIDGPLHFELSRAYDFAAAIFVLFYIFPIIGGWLNDHKITAFHSVIAGLCIKLPAYIILSFFSNLFFPFLLAVAALIIGNLFYRTPMIMLLRELSNQAKIRTDISYNFLFIAYQTGALVGIAASSYFAQIYGYNIAFALMACAIACELILLLALKIDKIPFPSYKALLIGLGGILLTALFLTFPHILDYFVPFALIGLIIYLIHLWKKFAPKDKERCKIIFFFMGILWLHLTFYAQINLSFLVYLKEYVNRNFLGFLLPAPWLQSFSAFFMIFFTLFFIQKLKKTDAKKQFFYARYMRGVGAAFLGYATLFLATYLNLEPLYFFFFLGVSILLAFAQATLYPIAMSSITAIAPERYKGFFVGIWGFGAAFSFYAAGELAKLTASQKNFTSFTHIGQKITLDPEGFIMLLAILTFSTALLFLLMLIFRKKMSYFENKLHFS